MDKFKFRILAFAAAAAMVLPLLLPVLVGVSSCSAKSSNVTDTLPATHDIPATQPATEQTTEVLTELETSLPSTTEPQAPMSSEPTVVVETTVPEAPTQPAKPEKPKPAPAKPEKPKPAPENLHNSTVATSDEAAKPSNWSEADIHLLATALYLEGRGESKKCQAYIGSVVINRMLQSNKSLRSVLYAKNQFSVAADLAHTEPSSTQLDIASQLAKDGSCLPPCVTFFRAKKYHDSTTVNTRYIKPYMCVDTTYFSHDIRICGDNH